MDIFDFMMSWGNASALNYWHQSLGWGYMVIKFFFYTGLFAFFSWWIFNKWRNKFQVDIEVVGPGKTIIEFMDTGRYTKDGTMLILKRRKKDILAPDKKYIIPVTGNFFIKGKIRLYQYGETEYSYVPIKTELYDEDEIELDEEGNTILDEEGNTISSVKTKLKFIPVDAKLSLINNLYAQAEKKFDTKNWFAQNAHMVVTAGFVIVCFVLFLVLLEQMKPLLASTAAMVEQAKLAVEAGARCKVAAAGAPIL